MKKNYLATYVTTAVNSSMKYSIVPAIIRATFDLHLKAANPYITDGRFVMNKDEHTTRTYQGYKWSNKLACFKKKVLFKIYNNTV